MDHSDILDADDVIFAADGSVESMTDPDTGEKVTADPQPDEDRDPDGPYDHTDADGNRPDDDGDNDNDELDPVLADVLEAYGLEDDTIEWNGEETRVRDLSPEDRKEFLAELRTSAAGLTPEEQELLDFVRQGGSLREAFASEATAAGTGIAALPADELNRADIRAQYKNFSEDEVEAELEYRKGNPNFERKTGEIRERLTAQEQEQAAIADEQSFRQEQQLFVESAKNLKAVLGFPIEPEVADYLLQRTATREANGMSPFLNSLTPEKMLRLEYLDTYADQIDAHYKAEVAAAHKRGRTEALRGAPSTPRGRGGSVGTVSSARSNGRPDAEFTLGED
ncbi:hypothetical protein [Hymenobacter siberiensis]|uniref:hypothetical protein n=1 Tax=Hymenobacter siberiensis TaxID=2848396 RepID=UPI001C1DE7C2|nr:hypothetical protein [Hymenobacter siberiensis]